MIATTVYKATMSKPSVIGLLLCAVTIAMIVVVIVRWKHSPAAWRVFFTLISAVLLICSISIVYSYIREYRSVFLPYKRGDYLVADGVVRNYEKRTINQALEQNEFEIDNVEFQLPSMSEYGYSLTESNGGIIREGMHLRIKYRFFRYENVILEIEIIEDDES